MKKEKNKVCPNCSSKNIEVTESINRILYWAIYVAMIGFAAWIIVVNKITSVWGYILVGLGASYIVFITKLMLEKKKIITYKCADCRKTWK